MKKLFINLIMVAMIGFVIAPGASAQSSNLSSDSNSLKDKDALSEKVIDEVEPYIELDDDSFKLTNKTQVQNKLSKSEFEAVKKQISKINASLKGHDNLKKISGEKAFTVEYTNEEVAEILEESDYEFDESERQQLFAKEGKTKVKFHIWGFEVWLSKTVTSTVVEAGINGGAVLASIATGGLSAVALPLLQAAAGYVGGKIGAGMAKPVYFKIGALQGVHGFKFQ